MDVARQVRTLREALDYVMGRIIQIEALCREVAKVREAVEAAREELDTLEARGKGASLRELQAILERVDRAQSEWEEFASRLSGIWAPRGGVH